MGRWSSTRSTGRSSSSPETRGITSIRVSPPGRLLHQGPAEAARILKI
ncbi:hypothetical protein GBAR_LOCUS9040 [Geodia barretti]|uniref:Uncharacterized protein n=1 Tax=Geodia barretti TaxID=519541 RepID=A0AA35WI20_GEOBA|nr:hypothetical protein GBAR_LOCUS9040 [Geodia barretti]